MKIHYLQHVPFEDPAEILTWAKANQAQVTSTKLYDAIEFPSPNEIDLLVVMGGPMNIYEEAKYPWLVSEKEFLKQCLDQKIKIIGICLGAQLLADCLGARVIKSPQKEIGWFPVHLTEDGKKHSFLKGIPEKFHCFHWHGDMFEIPEGAELLAGSTGCLHQAFQFQDHILGLQFHLESNKESIQKLIRNCQGEIVKGQFIQSEEKMLSQVGSPDFTHDWIYQILSNMINKSR